MKPILMPSDITRIQQKVDESHDAQTEQIVGLIIPAIEAVEISANHQLDDLSRDTAMGFSEVHGKIEYLRSELQEIKQTLNSLFR